MNEFGKATIKMEGDVADPDEFVWECSCDDCLAQYQAWKEAFEAQRAKMKELDA